jgi:hypothetical protein
MRDVRWNSGTFGHSRAATIGEAVENVAIRHLKVLALGASCAILGLATILAMPSPQPVQVASGDPVIVGSITPQARVPARPEWQDIRKPVEMIALQSTQMDRIPMTYRARRSLAGDREDALIWSGGGQQTTEAEIAVVRRTSAAQAPSLYIEISRRQGERGVAITRNGMPGLVTTKFGKLEVADMTFTDGQQQAQACLGFRSVVATEIGLAGWFCAPQGASVERPELSCFIDRLSLLKSGEDHKLRQFFTEAEQRRQACPTTRVSTGRKPTWLDSDGKAPAIRGDITGSIPRK